MPRILWVEDEALSKLIMYKEPLIEAGYIVDIATDASEAIDYLKQIKYEIIVIDIYIPLGFNYKTDKEYIGLELLKDILNNIINSTYKYTNQNIIILTVVDAPEAQKIIDELKIPKEFYLLKNKTTPELLLEKVNELLKTNKNM